MNPAVALLLILGLFLIMDAISDERVAVARKESSAEVRRVDVSALDDQMSSSPTKDLVTSMFENQAPWAFRDDGVSAPKAPAAPDPPPAIARPEATAEPQGSSEGGMPGADLSEDAVSLGLDQRARARAMRGLDDGKKPG